MTTIAYRDGIIATDSRTVRGTTVATDYGTDKIGRHGSLVFFMAGSLSDYESFMESFVAGKPVKRFIEVSALVFDEDTRDLWYSGIDNPAREFWKQRLNRDTYTAIGSGSPHALTAMDCGQTAVQAVAMAAMRDLYTGGMIHTYDVNNPEAGIE